MEERQSPFAPRSRFRSLLKDLPHPVPTLMENVPPGLAKYRNELCAYPENLDTCFRYAEALFATPPVPFDHSTWRPVGHAVCAHGVVCMTTRCWEELSLCVAIALVGVHTYADEVLKGPLQARSVQRLLRVAGASVRAENIVNAWHNKPDWRKNREIFECHPHFVATLRRLCENLYRFAVVRAGKRSLSARQFAEAMHCISQLVHTEGKCVEDVQRLGPPGEALNRATQWLAKASSFEYHATFSEVHETQSPELSFWHQSQAWELTRWAVEDQVEWFKEESTAEELEVQKRLSRLELAAGASRGLGPRATKPEFVETVTFPPIEEEDLLVSHGV